MSDYFLQSPTLESLLNEIDHPDAEQAAREYRHLRAVQRHLLTHLSSIKLQTESSIAGIQDEVDAQVAIAEVPPQPGLASPEASV